jgi:toxin ParE1/3/4
MGWYSERVPGLERDLYAAFLEALNVVAESPLTYQRVRGEVRRIVLRRFPYLLFYFIDEEVEPPEVVVLTFLHERRSPDRWPSG